MDTTQTTIDGLVEDFDFLDDWEDRYRYVIELGKSLPPLADSERTDANKVRGCASQVWLVSEVARNGEPARIGARPRRPRQGLADACRPGARLARQVRTRGIGRRPCIRRPRAPRDGYAGSGPAV